MKLLSRPEATRAFFGLMRDFRNAHTLRETISFTRWLVSSITSPKADLVKTDDPRFYSLHINGRSIGSIRTELGEQKEFYPQEFNEFIEKFPDTFVVKDIDISDTFLELGLYERSIFDLLRRDIFRYWISQSDVRFDPREAEGKVYNRIEDFSRSRVLPLTVKKYESKEISELLGFANRTYRYILAKDGTHIPVAPEARDWLAGNEESSIWQDLFTKKAFVERRMWRKIPAVLFQELQSRALNQEWRLWLAITSFSLPHPDSYRIPDYPEIPTMSARALPWLTPEIISDNGSVIIHPQSTVEEKNGDGWVEVDMSQPIDIVLNHTLRIDGKIIKIIPDTRIWYERYYQQLPDVFIGNGAYVNKDYELWLPDGRFVSLSNEESALMYAGLAIPEHTLIVPKGVRSHDLVSSRGKRAPLWVKLQDASRVLFGTAKQWDDIRKQIAQEHQLLDVQRDLAKFIDAKTLNAYTERAQRALDFGALLPDEKKVRRSELCKRNRIGK